MCQARQQSRSRTQTYGSERLGFSISTVGIILIISIISIIISLIEFGKMPSKTQTCGAGRLGFNIRCRFDGQGLRTNFL